MRESVISGITLFYPFWLRCKPIKRICLSQRKKQQLTSFVPLTLKAHPSLGCASSTYTIRKSAVSPKCLAISENSSSLFMKTGQVILPKFTMRGRLPLAMSRRWYKDLPSQETSLELCASSPSLTLFWRSSRIPSRILLYICHVKIDSQYVSFFISIVDIFAIRRGMKWFNSGNCRIALKITNKTDKLKDTT